MQETGKFPHWCKGELGRGYGARRFDSGARRSGARRSERDDSIPVRDDTSETERSGARRGDPSAIRCDTARYETIPVRYGSIPVRDGSIRTIRVRYGPIPARYGVPEASSLQDLQEEVPEGRTPLLGQ